jgi:prophage regulatory protein
MDFGANFAWVEVANMSSIRPIYLDLASVAKVVSLSVSTIEKLVREGAFPAPRLLSGRRVAWLLSEVEAWCEQRPVSNLPPPHNAGRRKSAKLPVEQVAPGELRAG